MGFVETKFDLIAENIDTVELCEARKLYRANSEDFDKEKYKLIDGYYYEKPHIVFIGINGELMKKHFNDFSEAEELIRKLERVVMYLDPPYRTEYFDYDVNAGTCQYEAYYRYYKEDRYKYLDEFSKYEITTKERGRLNVSETKKWIKEMLFSERGNSIKLEGDIATTIKLIEYSEKCGGGEGEIGKLESRLLSLERDLAFNLILTSNYESCKIIKQTLIPPTINSNELVHITVDNEILIPLTRDSIINKCDEVYYEHSMVKSNGVYTAENIFFKIRDENKSGRIWEAIINNQKNLRFHNFSILKK